MAAGSQRLKGNSADLDMAPIMISTRAELTMAPAAGGSATISEIT